MTLLFLLHRLSESVLIAVLRSSYLGCGDRGVRALWQAFYLSLVQAQIKFTIRNQLPFKIKDLFRFTHRRWLEKRALLSQHFSPPLIASSFIDSQQIYHLFSRDSQ